MIADTPGEDPGVGAGEVLLLFRDVANHEHPAEYDMGKSLDGQMRYLPGTTFP